MAQLEKPKNAKLLQAMVDPEILPSWLSREDLAYYVEQFQKSGFRGGVSWYRNIVHNIQITPQLETEKIRQPACFIAGAQDDVLKYVPGFVDLMDDWFEDLRVKTLLDNAGHWVQVEQAEKTTAALIDFLKGLR